MVISRILFPGDPSALAVQNHIFTGSWTRIDFVKIATYVLLAMLVLLQYPLWFGNGGVFAVWRLHREIAAQQKENDQLKERNRTLEAQVNDLKQGLEVIEGRARSELGMVKKGEAFYQVIDPKTAAEPPEKTPPANK